MTDREGSGPPPGSDENSDRRISSFVSWAVTLFLVGLVVAVVGYGVTRTREEPPPPFRDLANVEVVTVEARPYREALVLPAVLEADDVAAVSPEFAGRLARWRVEEGEAVEEGQVVAGFETSELEANLTELRRRKRSAELSAERTRVSLEGAKVALENARKEEEIQKLALRAAESTLELAQSEYKRAQKLVEERVLDQASLDNARNAFTQAQVGVEQAREAIQRAALAVRAAESQVEEGRASLALARATAEELDAAIDTLGVRIGKARLRAPISGRVEEHLVEPGEVVGAGVPVARIYKLDHLRAVVDVPDRYVAFLDPDNPAVLEYVRLNRPGAIPEVNASVIVPGLPKLTGGETPGLRVPAEIVRVAQAADPETSTFDVELRVPNPGNALKHGVLARGRIEYLTYPEAIVIPVRAVQVTDVGPRAMVVETVDGRSFARVRDIEPASIREDELLILHGLRVGERLIVSGWKGLVPGEEVSVLVEDGNMVTAGRAAEGGAPGDAERD